MKEKIQNYLRKYPPTIIAGIVCFIVALFILVFPAKKAATQIDLSEYATIKPICEFATLKCFYHNVVVYEEEPNETVKTISTVLLWPFDRFAKTGYKQFWMEYSGIVEAGIDARQVNVNEPDANNTIEIYVPDATILSVHADLSSLSEPLTEMGLFTNISKKEQTNAFSKAQKVMQEEAEKDQAILDRAKDNAKILLEQYVRKMGEAVGINYSVKWINNPK